MSGGRAAIILSTARWSGSVVVHPTIAGSIGSPEDYSGSGGTVQYNDI